MSDIDFLKELGDRIKSLRIKAGLSQDDLAKKLNYKSRSTIAKIESGINDIPQSKILEFANALKTTPTYLMGWEKTAQPSESGFYSFLEEIGYTISYSNIEEDEGVEIIYPDGYHLCADRIEMGELADKVTDFIASYFFDLKRHMELFKSQLKKQEMSSQTLNLKSIEEQENYDSTPIAASGSEDADEDELEVIKQDIDEL